MLSPWRPGHPIRNEGTDSWDVFSDQEVFEEGLEIHGETSGVLVSTPSEFGGNRSDVEVTDGVERGMDLSCLDPVDTRPWVAEGPPFSQGMADGASLGP